MLRLSYNQFYSLVDGIDEYIGDGLTRRKFRGLLGDISHYRRIKKEYNENPLIAIMAIIGLKYQAGGLIADITPRATVKIAKGTTLESMLALLKSYKYKPFKKKKYENI